MYAFNTLPSEVLFGASEARTGLAGRGLSTRPAFEDKLFYMPLPLAAPAFCSRVRVTGKNLLIAVL
jgi:hypothetical protein